MQGRMTGSIGIHKAAAYIAKQMHDIGLEPGGDSGYFQRVPLSSRHSKRGMHLLRSWAAFDSLQPDERVVDANVIGILRGSDPILRDSIILVDAHYDHLGMGSPVKGDSIYNGADDDASGTVTVLEIARALARGPRPKRTIIFMATTGEEVGLFGTNWYIKHPVVPLSSMSANLEIEMDGRPDSLAGGPGKLWLTGFKRSTMGAMFQAGGLAIVADPRPSQQFFQRSDNIAFAEAGIPAHTLSSFNLHDDYHQPSDDVSKIDFAHFDAVISVAARAVTLLANGPTPVWNPGGKPRP
jgi:Zn-dependent M28 family amino/carboxypeptidase